MKNAKYLRYAFCVMVLLGMGQQALPMKLSRKEKIKLKEKTQREEKLRIAEKRVVETKQLVKQAEKKEEQADKEEEKAKRKKKQAIKKADKTGNRLELKRQSYLKALDVADFPRTAKTRASAKKEWTQASRAHDNALRKRKEAVGEYVLAQHVCIVKISALAQAKDTLAHYIKERRQAKRAYRQAQGNES